jgi:hypothetical protein
MFTAGDAEDAEEKIQKLWVLCGFAVNLIFGSSKVRL